MPRSKQPPKRVAAIAAKALRIGEKFKRAITPQKIAKWPVLHGVSLDEFLTLARFVVAQSPERKKTSHGRRAK